MSDKTPTPPVAVTLLKAHRHAGRDYKPGQVIRLAPHKADWLISQKVAQELDAKPAAEAAAEPEAAADPAKPAKAKQAKE